MLLKLVVAFALSSPWAALAAPVDVVAVNYPLAYFAERLGGDAVKVTFPVPADEDPAFWEPKPEELAALSNAALVLDNGAGYAPWLAGAKFPSGKVVDTSAAFSRRLIGKASSTTDDHHTRRFAFTTWTDLQLAQLQAAAVRDALATMLPDQKAALDQRLVTLQAELADLDRRTAEAAPALGTLLTSHPVYDYWLRRYAVKAFQLHWEPDEKPSTTSFKTAAALAKKNGVKWVVWEGQPLAASVETLRRLGLASVVVDPCGNRPETGDFMTVMRENVEALEAAVKAGRSH